MTRRRRWLLGVLVATAAAVLVLGATWSRWLPALAHWLDVGERPRGADYVAVLGGDEESRPLVAAALVRTGFARRVLIPEVVASPSVLDGIEPPPHELSRRVLLAAGIRAEQIEMLPGASSNTYTDGEVLARFLAGSPSSRILVVTSGPHTRRTRWVLARVLGDRMRQITLVSVPSDSVDPDRWWQTERGFLTIVGEYFKLAAYAARYGQFVYWLLAGIGAAAAGVLCGKIIRRRRKAPADRVGRAGDPC